MDVGTISIAKDNSRRSNCTNNTKWKQMKTSAEHFPFRLYRGIAYDHELLHYLTADKGFCFLTKQTVRFRIAIKTRSPKTTSHSLPLATRQAPRNRFLNNANRWHRLCLLHQSNQWDADRFISSLSPFTLLALQFSQNALHTAPHCAHTRTRTHAHTQAPTGKLRARNGTGCARGERAVCFSITRYSASLLGGALLFTIHTHEHMPHS